MDQETAESSTSDVCYKKAVDKLRALFLIMNIDNEAFDMQWETSEYSTILVWYKDVMDVNEYSQ